MATITTYKCDRCSKELQDRKTLKCVSAGVGDYSGSDSWAKSFRQDWCFECCSEFGIWPKPKAQSTSTEIQQPTLEDMIREIIRNETR